MTEPAQTVQVGVLVSPDIAERLRELAKQSERSLAAEARLAFRAWIEAAEETRQAA